MAEANTIHLRSGGDYAAALRALRGGQTLLLERGGTYDVDKGVLPYLTGGVAGVTIGAFGDAAKPPPRIASDRGGLYAERVSRLTVRDVQFKPRPIGVGDGVRLLDVDDVTLEGLIVNEHAQGIVIQGVRGRCQRVIVRGCRVYDNADPAGGKGQGLYASNTDGLVLVCNAFVRNGWLPGRVKSNVLSHNVYVHQSCGPIVAASNVFADAASHGLQARSGGAVRDNLFVGNPIQLSFGYVNGTGAPVAGGVSGTIAGNVFIGPGRDIAGSKRGWGVELANCRSVVVENNLAAHDRQGAACWQLKPCGAQDNSRAVGLLDLAFAGNRVWDWSGSPLHHDPRCREERTGNHSTTRLDLSGQTMWAPTIAADLTAIVNVDVVRELLKTTLTDRTVAQLVDRCRAAVEDPKLQPLRARLADLEGKLIPAAEEVAAAAAAMHAGLLTERRQIRATLGMKGVS